MSSELRLNPLSNRWVVISPGRQRRPQDFIRESNNKPIADCKLCKGNEKETPPEIFAVFESGFSRKDFRVIDGRTDYGSWVIRVVPNKFGFLSLDSQARNLGRQGVGPYDRMDGYGAHELVIECPGPEHIEIADCKRGDWRVEKLFWLFRERMCDLSKNKRLNYFLLFKNYKPEAGASLVHPHCQLVGMPIVPREEAQELMSCKAYYEDKTRCLLCDMIGYEIESSKRIVVQSKNFVVFCPYASRFPGEMLIAPMPDNHLHQFNMISDELIRELSDIFTQAMKKLKTFFADSAYNWSLHSAPVRFNKKNHGETIEDDTHWHLHILPRITKIAGFEIGADLYINPSPPEEIAEALRDVSTI